MAKRPTLPHHDFLDCEGEYQWCGLPSVRWWQPSLSYPDRAREARFLPQAVQLLRCTTCRYFDMCYLNPIEDLYRVERGARLILPTREEWVDAWAPTPHSVREECLKAQRGFGEGPEISDDTLVRCRRTVEHIVRSLGHGNDQWPLATQIEALRKTALLPPELTELAHAIRRLSNPGAHTGQVLLGAEEVGTGSYRLEAEATLALFHLQVLIARIWIVPLLMQTCRNDPMWMLFNQWLESQRVGMLA